MAAAPQPAWGSSGETQVKPAPDGLLGRRRGFIPHGVSTLDRHVYRSAGRVSDTAPIPTPSTRRLLSPLRWGIGALLSLLVPLVALGALFDPDASNGSRETRPVPRLETLQDVVMLAMLASLLVTVGVLVRRVVPLWSGLGRSTRGLYVATLLVLQSGAIVSAEVVAFESRGGLHLFEPTLSGSTTLPDGRTAHVYASGLFGATYDVYVAERFAPLMHKKLRISRDKLERVVPRVRSNADGSLELVDADGARLESQPPRLPPFLFGGGC
jgi:hypothetical protein